MMNLCSWLLAIVSIIFVIILKNAKRIYLASKLVGPKGYPIVGNGLLFFNKTPLEVIEIVRNLIQKYGRFMKIWMMDDLMIVVLDPKDVEIILSSTKLITKSDDYDFMKPWLGEGLLTSTGNKWASRRKIITPTFHFKILEQFVEIFDRQSNILINKLQGHKNSEAFDIFPSIAFCALDIICETAMGTTSHAQDGNSEYAEAVVLITDLMRKRSLDFLLRYNFFFRISPMAMKQRKLLKVLHSFTDRVIVDRRKMISEFNKDTLEETLNEDIGIKKKMAFLDLLLGSTINGKALTNLEIREEVDTFMFEGHDTTSSGIAYTLYSIAKNPEVQQKVVDEIKSVMGDDAEKAIGLKELNELHYLELVIKETLRLYPSVPIYGRKSMEDVDINGKIIPKGSNIIVCPYFMGRDALIWDKPEQFNPDRFNVEITRDKLNPYAYIPFSAGSRNCIGQKFAMLELKSTVSKIIRNFHISTAADYKTKDFLEVIEIVRNLIQKYGRFMKIWMMDDLMIVVLDPKDVEIILSSTKLITKSDDYDFMKPWLGEGLLTSTGNKWTSRRKIITPTFHFKILEQFVEIFDRQSNILINKLQGHKNSEAFDIFPILTIYTLDIICETAMGTTSNAQDGNSEYAEAVDEITDLMRKRSLDFLLRYNFFFRISPMAMKQRKLLKVLHSFTDRVIVDRRKMISEFNKDALEETLNEDIGIKKKMAFLDLLLGSTINGKALTNLEIREEVDTFMFAGHDTTSSGIAYTLYSIAKNPEVQQKVVDEIKSVMGDDAEKAIGLKELNDLHYLELVIKETLRLYPSVPIYGRKSMEDVDINGKIIPKGSNIMVCPYFMGRDPLIWDKPEQFNPDRFNVEIKRDKLNPYAYVPFSAGSRNCIGQKFAMLEMKSTISRTLRHFKLSVEEGYEPILINEIILRPENGVKLHLNERIYQ
ncbi:unnamed protein product [Diamesa serratosioi]